MTNFNIILYSWCFLVVKSKVTRFLEFVLCHYVCVFVFVGCLDMLATNGYFTFAASQPQLACAAFIIAEPNEVISLELYHVSIDCSAGDFIKVGSTHQK